MGVWKRISSVLYMHGTGYGINLIKLIPYRLIPICTMSLARGAGYNDRSTSVPQIKVTPGQHVRADIYIPLMQVDGCRGVCLDVSRVHDFHGSSGVPSKNGTLRHSDINLELSQRAKVKVDKYRAGYAALTRHRGCVTPFSQRLSPRLAASVETCSGCCTFLPTRRLRVTLRHWMRP